MNIKMATNTQLSTTESIKQTKQKSRTGRESQKWRSCGGLSAARGKGEKGEKGAGIEKYKLLGTHTQKNCQVQNTQEDVENSIGNGVAKELICTIHGNELRGGKCQREWEYWAEGDKRGKVRHL